MPLLVQSWNAVPEGCYSSPNPMMTPPLVDDLQTMVQFEPGKQQVVAKRGKSEEKTKTNRDQSRSGSSKQNPTRQFKSETATV